MSFKSTKFTKHFSTKDIICFKNVEFLKKIHVHLFINNIFTLWV